MTITKRSRGLALVAGLLAAPLAAGEPYYFHKPGVAEASFVEDVEVCRDLAGMGRAKKLAVPYSPNIYATMAAAFVGGFMNAGAQRRHQQGIERICMADKGYARVAIDKSELKRIRKLDDDTARMSALFTLSAAPTALGEELPE